MKQNKINSIQFLRFIAFMFIFLWHTSHIYPTVIGPFAQTAVTFFVLLSGFVTCYNGLEKIASFKLKNQLKYMLKKLKKFYPGYILSGFIFIFWDRLIVFLKQGNIEAIKRLVVYITMTQVYTTSDHYWFVLNGALWFISLMFTLYIVSLFTFKVIVKIKDSLKWNIVSSISLFVILFIYNMLMQRIPNNNYWLYICPIPRIMEFTLAALIANIYRIYSNMNTKNDFITKILFTGLEVFALFIFIVHNYIECGYLVWSFIHIIPSLLIIFVFAVNKGYISALFSKKPFVFLGNLSTPLYITHVVFIRLIKDYYAKLLGLTSYKLVIVIFICMLIFNSIFTILIKEIKKQIKLRKE